MKIIDNINLYSPQQNDERNEIYHLEIGNGKFSSFMLSEEYSDKIKS